MDYLDRASIEVLECRIFSLLEGFLVSFTVMVFTPTPVLESLVRVIAFEYIDTSPFQWD